MTAPKQIAQLNLARMRAPIDSQLMTGFVARLDEINGLADRSPGFVWRLQTDDGDATAVRVFNDATLIVNLSVWQSIEHLRDFVYQSTHRELILARKQWFEKMAGPHLALWHVCAGHRPTVEEACEKMEQLRRDGPGDKVFTFATIPQAKR